MQIQTEKFGRIEVSSLPLPETVKECHHPIYTYTGTVLFAYKTAVDLNRRDYYHIGVINDDGTDLRTIFSGEIPQLPTANGIRLMPFWDKKRVLLGDYVVECEPDIDNCQTAKLVIVQYPDFILTSPGLFCHWSEIVISPDNRYMAWTCLVGEGAVNFLAQLDREKAGYVLKNVKTISNTKGIEEDPAHPGCLHLIPTIGGEIKQFIHGGAALSLVGSVNSPLPDSVEQDLKTGITQAVTHMRGYEETTIFSPDEKLGIVMSTRGSAKTNFAILGLVPRPYGYLVTQALSRYAYMYGVAAVRRSVKGNVGPVLIDLEQSKGQWNYSGVQLNDPNEEWVYYSPMSWRPDGKKALWPEKRRGSGEERIQIVHLLDYQPEIAVPAVETPMIEAYGEAFPAVPAAPAARVTNGCFMGQNSGKVHYKFTPKDDGRQVSGLIETIYHQYSDDGRSFYNGYERLVDIPGEGIQYEAELSLSGERNGRMDLRFAFGEFGYDSLPVLYVEPAEDGLPMSRGNAEYEGVRLSIESMLEV